MKMDETLAKSQNISSKQRENIVNIMIDIEEVFKCAKEDKNPGKSYQSIIRDLEFKLQENYNFEKDENYHTYWFKVPHCTCDVIQNIGLPLPERIYEEECPIHKHNSEK